MFTQCVVYKRLMSVGLTHSKPPHLEKLQLCCLKSPDWSLEHFCLCRKYRVISWIMHWRGLNPTIACFTETYMLLRSSYMCKDHKLSLCPCLSSLQPGMCVSSRTPKSSLTGCVRTWSWPRWRTPRHPGTRSMRQRRPHRPSFSVAKPSGTWRWTTYYRWKTHGPTRAANRRRHNIQLY